MAMVPRQFFGPIAPAPRIPWRYGMAAGAVPLMVGGASLNRFARAAYRTVARRAAAIGRSFSTSASGTPGRNIRRLARRPAFRKSKSKKLKSKVDTIAKHLEMSQGTHIFRKRDVSFFGPSTVGKSAFNNVDVWNTTLCETALTNLKFFNASAPATLVTGSGASGTYHRDYHFAKVHVKLTLRNNYQVPIKVDARVYVPRRDTDQNVAQCFTAGLADVGNPSSTSTMVYPSDSPILTELWKAVKTFSRIIQPGKEYQMTYTAKPYDYQVDLSDVHNLTYTRKHKSMVLGIRTQGVLGHDTGLPELDTLEAGVDGEVMTTAVIKYDAGVDITTIELDDNGATAFTNGGVVSSKPVSDNIGYSIN